MSAECDEISPEALQQLNALLDEGPGEDATEEEVEAFMQKFADTPGGAAMLRTLRKQLANGSGEILSQIMGAELPSFSNSPDLTLYQPLQSSLRLVFHIQPVGAKKAHWRRLSLPSDASFFDLHFAIQDLFAKISDGLHRFEWRQGEKVEATFLSGEQEVLEGDDYCEYQNRPLDLFSESVDRFLYCLEDPPVPAFIVTVEKLIEPSGFEKEKLALEPSCIDGEGPGDSFVPSEVKFRSPVNSGAGD